MLASANFTSMKLHTSVWFLGVKYLSACVRGIHGKGLLPTVTEIREEREGLCARVHGSDKVWRRDREEKESAHERER